jgi:hypothetical protein
MIERITPLHKSCSLTNSAFLEFAAIETKIAWLRDESKGLYYQVMLFQKPCPLCKCFQLTMVEDGVAHCSDCGERFDATLAFQVCGRCQAVLTLKTFHYWCPKCQEPVRSLFRLESRVFDAGYFKERMKECRERKQESKEVFVSSMAEARSGVLELNDAPSLDSVPNLELDLNALLGQALSGSLPADVESHFDLERYRRHLLDLLECGNVRFDGISSLIDDRRKDRVFRFIAAIFLEHEGQLEFEERVDYGLMLVAT